MYIGWMSDPHVFVSQSQFTKILGRANVCFLLESFSLFKYWQRPTPLYRNVFVKIWKYIYSSIGNFRPLSKSRIAFLESWSAASLGKWTKTKTKTKTKAKTKTKTIVLLEMYFSFLVGRMEDAHTNMDEDR